MTQQGLVLVTALFAVLVLVHSVPLMPMPEIDMPTGFTKLGVSNQSALYAVDGTAYDTAPLVLQLRGSRRQIGYDYAALMTDQTSFTFTTFLESVFPDSFDQILLSTFLDYCWDHFLVPYTPQVFLDELAGMDDWTADNADRMAASPSLLPASVVAQRFYTLANLPADTVNIIYMLENEEEAGLPLWLKNEINRIIGLLERLLFTCDAYGVWGSRTVDSLLYSSRNLDYNCNTGINRFKLVIFYDIAGVANKYASIGFAFGPGALAGISAAGVTVSEMNLDNSVVDFTGPPFPLRLRMVLEQATNLETAQAVWNSTNNTNSFNFLIASAADNSALALETISGFTAYFGADSPIEAAATYYCANASVCSSWTNETGQVKIGFPLADVVWRTNHGMHPRVMATQEPLFNDTVFRYDLMHNIFSQLQGAGQLIDDNLAVNIVATLGIKGSNFLTCEQDLTGSNAMSIAYAPGNRGANSSALGAFYAAWEAGGISSGTTWYPAACAHYVYFSLDQWLA